MQHHDEAPDAARSGTMAAIDPSDISYQGMVSDSEAQFVITRPAPLPVRLRVVVAALLIMPIIALVTVPTYSNASPHLWGFPFFYWYTLLWMFIETAMCSAAYLLVTRARRDWGTR